jgi:hypothetical protein
MRRLAIFLALSLASAATVACPIERAHYTYSAGQGAASFAVLDDLTGYVSKLSIHLQLAGKRDLWFLFDAGSARYISLISVTDPRMPGWLPPDPDGGKRPIAAQKFFAWNDDLKIYEDVPQAGTRAPKFILIPDLPETLQYGSRDRLAIGAGIFKLDRCDPRR